MLHVPRAPWAPFPRLAYGAAALAAVLVREGDAVTQGQVLAWMLRSLLEWSSRPPSATRPCRAIRPLHFASEV
jgi:hypothetical protein